LFQSEKLFADKRTYGCVDGWIDIEMGFIHST